MKVIFIKDLKKQGRVNDIKEVSDGYATNYLIKNGYAVKYTKCSNERLQNELDIKAREEEKEIDNANKIKEKLNDVCLTFKVKCSNDGKVFGSISSKQISDKLNELGYSIDKKDIKLNETLNTLGMYNVEVVIYKKVKGNIKVELKK